MVDLRPREKEFLVGPNCCGLSGEPTLYADAFAPALLFKAVRDGWTANHFHGRVDNHSPTLVVFKTNDK